MCPAEGRDNKRLRALAAQRGEWLKSTGENKWKAPEGKEVKDVQVGSNQAGRKSECA